ncbi:unnamed protein product [Linum trigynum]|uniref:Uncharacterized protein n=1 Tax=Linum trigynum TaxID=586398 RepID=A0AAV2FYD4_9ROSI
MAPTQNSKLGELVTNGDNSIGLGPYKHALARSSPLPFSSLRFVLPATIPLPLMNADPASIFHFFDTGEAEKEKPESKEKRGSDQGNRIFSGARSRLISTSLISFVTAFWISKQASKQSSPLSIGFPVRSVSVLVVDSISEFIGST